jgi:hypothetical protein
MRDCLGCLRRSCVVGLEVLVLGTPGGPGGRHLPNHTSTSPVPAAESPFATLERELQFGVPHLQLLSQVRENHRLQLHLLVEKP